MDSAIAQTEVWSQRNAQRIAESKRKNVFTFWLIFDLSQNLGLDESLSERLIQKSEMTPVYCNRKEATLLALFAGSDILLSLIHAIYQSATSPDSRLASQHSFD